MRSWLLLLPLLVACGDPSSLPDEQTYAPDVLPPELDVRSPTRGTIQDGTPAIEVRGVARDRSGIREVRVNGVAATLGEDGAFMTSVPAQPGLTFLHTVATDGGGNQQTDTRAVLGGRLVPIETAVPGGILVHLDARALTAGATVGARQLEALDLHEKLAGRNPLVDLPVPCLGARIDLTRLDKGAVRLAVVPVDGGLEIDAEVDDLVATVRVAYDVGCKTGTADVTASARRFGLRGTLRLSIDERGELAVDASGTEARLEGFELDTRLLPARLVDFIEQPLGDTLAAVVSDVIRDRIPPLILDGLAGGTRLAGDRAQRLHIALRPTALHLDARRLGLTVTSSLYVEGGPATTYLASPAPAPRLDTTRVAAVGRADDTLNQLLSSLWSAGVFERELPVAGLGGGGLGGGLTTLFDNVELSLRLPPVLTAHPGRRGLELALGDAECHFTKKGKSVGRVSLSARVLVTVRVVDDRLTLVPAEPQVFLDVMHGERPDLFTYENVQVLGDFLSDNLVALVSDMAGDVPLPATSGLSVDDVVLGSAPEDGYIVVSGEVGAR